MDELPKYLTLCKNDCQVPKGKKTGYFLLDIFFIILYYNHQAICTPKRSFAFSVIPLINR